MNLLVGCILQFLLVVLLKVEEGAAIRWLALAHSDQRSTNSTSLRCRLLRSDGLNSRQVKFCKRDKGRGLMPLVMHAARDTIYACEHTFKERRWNCSTVHRAPSFLPDLTSGTREQAYVYALSGGAIAAAVSRACALGQLKDCTCAKLPFTSSPRDNFKWGGCGDDVEYGAKISAAFTDGNKPSGRSKKAVMSMHNYRAGRRLIEDSLRKTCKCHGVSGSCATKTCWMALPALQETAKNVKERYAVAVEVKNKKIRGRRNLLPINSRRGIEEEDLIYYTPSPDYCSYEAATGSLGTVGRYCVKDGENGSNCNTMCCGRGYRTYSYKKEERCHCKYIWCCYVKCKKCVRTVTINECL